MARSARIDSQIRANRLIHANRLRDSRNELPFCESRFGGLKVANRMFEAIRAKRSNVLKITVFLRIDSRESNSRASPRFALRIAVPSKF